MHIVGAACNSVVVSVEGGRLAGLGSEGLFWTELGWFGREEGKEKKNFFRKRLKFCFFAPI